MKIGDRAGNSFRPIGPLTGTPGETHNKFVSFLFGLSLLDDFIDQTEAKGFFR